MANFTIGGLDDLDRVLARLERPDDTLDKASSQVGELLLGRVKNLTPVDTGALRNAWKRTRPQDGSIEVYNNTEYAGHVEWGHRQEVGRYVPKLGGRLKKPLVEGRHMLRDAVAETEEQLREDVMEIMEGLLR